MWTQFGILLGVLLQVSVVGFVKLTQIARKTVSYPAFLFIIPVGLCLLRDIGKKLVEVAIFKSEIMTIDLI